MGRSSREGGSPLEASACRNSSLLAPGRAGLARNGRAVHVGTGGGSVTAADFVGEADPVTARYAIVRLADGTIVEAWGLWDQLGLLRQLGLVPAPPQPKR